MASIVPIFSHMAFSKKLCNGRTAAGEGGNAGLKEDCTDLSYASREADPEIDPRKAVGALDNCSAMSSGDITYFSSLVGFLLIVVSCGAPRTGPGTVFPASRAARESDI
jgi:hypothetical protein